MLEIKALNIRLYKNNRLIIKDFSFSLNNDDKVGLIRDEGMENHLL